MITAPIPATRPSDHDGAHVASGPATRGATSLAYALRRNPGLRSRADRDLPGGVAMGKRSGPQRDPKHRRSIP